MDLSKLNPFPWSTGSDEDGHMVYDANDCIVAGTDDGEEPTAEEPSREVVRAEFISLAGNAFDVMMRRGWHAMPDSEKWFVFGEGSLVLQAAAQDGPWPDPYTALVEADRWYRENIEKETQP